MASKNNGGIGFGSLRAFNIGLLYKWRWRFYNFPDSLWAKVITQIHDTSNWHDMIVKTRNRSGPWSSIVKMTQKLHINDEIPLNSIRKKVGDGQNTSFWNDIWVDDHSLKFSYPRLFALESDKNVNVRDRWNGATYLPNWRRPIRGGREEEQFSQMVDKIKNMTIVNLYDKWVWQWDSLKEFTVNGVRKKLDNQWLPWHFLTTKWLKPAPRKVNIFIWRAMKDRLPTRFNLWFRGVQDNSLMCPLCGNGIETTHHVMADCKIVKKVWNSIQKWLDLKIQYDLEINEVIDGVDVMKMSGAVKDIVKTILYATWWEIWKFRNETIFNPNKRREQVLVDSIITFSFLWYSNRGKTNKVKWDEWIRNPILYA